MKTRTTSRIIILFIFLLVLASLTTQANAHSLMVRSEPAQNASLDSNPPQIILTFSEPLQPQSSSVKVLDSSGGRVDLGNPAFSADYLAITEGLPSLAKGVYTVSWRVVSAADGHPTSGTFAFGVQLVVPPISSAQPSVDPPILSLIPETVARWTYYLGQTVMVGGPIFYLFVLTPWLKRKTIAAQPGLVVNVSRRVLLVSLAATALTIAGTLGLMTIQAYSAGSSTYLDFPFGTRLGQIGVSRLLFAAMIGFMLFLAYLQKSKPTSHMGFSLIIGVGLLLASSFSGHNAAVGGLAVASDWLHLLAVSAWVGGLLHFMMIVPLLKEGGMLQQHLAQLVPAFSRMAILSVGVVSVTGLYSALVLVGSFQALLGTQYGLTLVSKVSLMIILVILGGLNQLVWHPRVVKALRTVGQAGPALGGLGQRLAGSIRMEALLAIFLLVIVGLLTALPPGSQVAQNSNRPGFQPMTVSQTVQDVDVHLSIYPFRIGTNSFLVSLRDMNGAPLTDVNRVDFVFKYQDAPLAPLTTPAQQTGEGQFSAQGTFLSRPGNWRVEVDVVRPIAVFPNFDLNLQAYPGLDNAHVWEIPFPDTSVGGLDVQVDGSGNVWFSMPTAGSIGRYQPGIGRYDIFRIPQSNASPSEMALAKNGKLWYSDPLRSSIGSFNPTTGQFQEYLIPTTDGQAQPSGITIDNNGTIWFTVTNLGRVRAFNSTSNSFTVSLRTPTNSSAVGPITSDASGRVWFAAENQTSAAGGDHDHGSGGAPWKIVLWNPTAQNLTEYRPPTNSSLITGIQAAPNGDIWFAEHGTNRISRIHPADLPNASAFKQETITNTNAYPWGLKVDQQGNVWFAEHIGNKIGFYRVSTRTFSEYAIPTPDSSSTRVALDQFGNIWFAENAGKLGVLALEPQAVGLSADAQDTTFQLTVGLLIVLAAVSTLGFFVRHRRMNKVKPTIAQKQAKRRSR